MTLSSEALHKLILTQPVPADCPEKVWQRLFNYWLKDFATNKGNVIVSFVSSSTMRELHKTHLGTAEVTDVLTFPYVSKGGLAMPIGEIIICLPVAKAAAKKLKTSLELEITTLFVHGLLHLAGNDHANPIDQAKFENDTRVIMENEELKPVNLWSV